MGGLNFSIDRHREMVAGLEALRTCINKKRRRGLTCAPTRKPRRKKLFLIDAVRAVLGAVIEKASCYQLL